MELNAYTIDFSVTLGVEKFGNIHPAFKTDNKNDKYAIKCIDLNNLARLGLSEAYVQAEFELQKRVSGHKNIVNIYEMFKVKNTLYLALELCEDSSTLDVFTDTHCPPLYTKLSMMQQCTSTLAYLHNLPSPVFHRDIKPDNILVCEAATKPKIKFCDFGMGKSVDKQSTVYLSTFVGTPIYLPPELYPHGEFPNEDTLREIKFEGSRMDVFSLGLVFVHFIMNQTGHKFEEVVGKDLFCMVYIYCIIPNRKDLPNRITFL
jgi:serine/threonine protein kinase